MISILPPEIREVADVLSRLRVRWAIAGGWALDLSIGRITRPHADVDIAILRADQDALRAALPGWHFDVALGGRLKPWEAGVRLLPPVHEVHTRPPADGSEPALEFLLNERDGLDWVYRRDTHVRRPLARVFREACGLRVLAPEVVLLYKSKAPRAIDEHDFQAARPLLDADARAWLRDAILRADPRHRWAAALASDV